MGHLYTADKIYVKDSFQENYAFFVEAGKIKEIGLAEPMKIKYSHENVVELKDKAIIPGTVNAHNHSFQSLLRGIAADKPFLEWRDQALYRYTPFFDEEAVYNGALFAFGEMLRYGVTTVCDFFYMHNGGTACDEAVIQAANDLGIRIVLARTMYDWDGAPKAYIETVEEAKQRTLHLAKKYQGHPMVTIQPAPHSPHAASPEMIKAGHQLALELDTTFHIHVAEEMFEVEETLGNYGLRPVHYLDSLNVVDHHMNAIHLVWLDQSEINLLGSRNVSLSYCPSSNMFLADGISKIPELLNAGVRISLGSDGACSNNRISVFEEMRMCALLQKVRTLDGTCLNSKQVFDMGTKAGGDILKQKIGELKEGYSADFVTLNISDLSLQPEQELFSNIVYSMQPTAINDVYIEGRKIVANGHLQTISETQIRQKIVETYEKFNCIKN